MPWHSLSMATFTPFNHYRSFLPQDALAHFIVAAEWWNSTLEHGGLLSLYVALATLLALLCLSRGWELRTLDQSILGVLHLACPMVPVALTVKAAALLAGGGSAVNRRHLQDICAVGLMKPAVLPRATLGHIGHPLRAFGLVRAAHGPMLLRSRADGSPN